MNPSTVDILLAQTTADLNGKVEKRLLDVQRRHDELSSQIAEVRQKLEAERQIFEQMKAEFHLVESEELEAASRAISASAITLADVHSGKKSLRDFFQSGLTPTMLETAATEKIRTRTEEMIAWLCEKSLALSRLEFEEARLLRDIAELNSSPIKARLDVLKEMIDEISRASSAQDVAGQNLAAASSFQRAKDELRLAEGLLPQGHSFQVKSMKELLELRFHPGLREAARKRLTEIIAYMKKKKTFCRIFLVLDPYGQNIRRWWISDEEFQPGFLPPRPDESTRLQGIGKSRIL